MKANEQIWKPVIGWPDYSVSNNGSVYSHRRNTLMKVWSNGKTYPRVTLSIKGFEKSYCVHRLVAQAFIPNPDNKLTVNHIDGNKQNNHVSNLEWATFSENQKHAVSTGLSSVHDLGFGENHPSAKLNNVDVAMIKVLANNGFSNELISKRFGVHATHISSIVLGKTRKMDSTLTGEELTVNL